MKQCNNTYSIQDARCQLQALNRTSEEGQNPKHTVGDLIHFPNKQKRQAEK